MNRANIQNLIVNLKRNHSMDEELDTLENTVLILEHCSSLCFNSELNVFDRIDALSKHLGIGDNEMELILWLYGSVGDILEALRGVLNE